MTSSCVFIVLSLSCSNKSSCSKIAMRFKVLRLDEVINDTDCDPPILRPAVATKKVIVPLQEGNILDCPDLQDAAKMADSKPNVTWYHMLQKSSVIL